MAVAVDAPTSVPSYTPDIQMITLLKSYIWDVKDQSNSMMTTRYLECDDVVLHVKWWKHENTLFIYHADIDTGELQQQFTDLCHSILDDASLPVSKIHFAGLQDVEAIVIKCKINEMKQQMACIVDTPPFAGLCDQTFDKIQQEYETNCKMRMSLLTELNELQSQLLNTISHKLVGLGWHSLSDSDFILKK